MKLGSFKRLMKQDYDSDSQSLVEKLSFSINAAIESLFDALNKKLTLKENISATVKTFDVRVDANGAPQGSPSISLDSTQTTLEGLSVIRVDNLDNSTTYPPGGIGISFDKNNNDVLINNIKGLTANTNYRIKVIAWG